MWYIVTDVAALTLNASERKVQRCSEHISPKSVREKWNMASERECPLQTDVRFSREDVLREELSSLTDNGF